MASTPVLIDGYGTAHVTHTPNPDKTEWPLITATFETMRRNDDPDAVPGTWVLQMYPEEALAFAAALITHARAGVLELT